MKLHRRCTCPRAARPAGWNVAAGVVAGVSVGVLVGQHEADSQLAEGERVVQPAGCDMATEVEAALPAGRRCRMKLHGLRLHDFRGVSERTVEAGDALALLHRLAGGAA